MISTFTYTASFPHTTDTVQNNVNTKHAGEMSLHLTFHFDTHVWDLDYLSVRRLALRRAGVVDSSLEQGQDTDNKNVDNVNLLEQELRDDLLKHLPLGLLEEDENVMVDNVTKELQRISEMVDKDKDLT